MHGFAHQSHSLAHRVMNFTETLGGLFLSGNLGHHVRRLGLHDGSGQHVADIVMDLTCDACAFGKRRRADGQRTILVVFGDLRAQAANLVAAGILQSPHFAGEVRAARAKQAGSESQNRLEHHQYDDGQVGWNVRANRTENHYRHGKKPQPSRHQRLQEAAAIDTSGR